jgi:hypothetical protein
MADQPQLTIVITGFGPTPDDERGVSNGYLQSETGSILWYGSGAGTEGLQQALTTSDPSMEATLTNLYPNGYTLTVNDTTSVS